MRTITGLIFLTFLGHSAEAQKKVVFQSSDGLTVTADLYLKDPKLPFILLFHQNNFSRGEFREIAPKLLNLNYNCLSVDLRNGDKINFIENETSLEATKRKFPHSMLDAKADMLAAIQYAFEYSNKPVILLGSTYSASLSLLTAPNNPHVSAVIAFSPGEFFHPEVIVRESVKDFNKPLFIGSTNAEYAYLVKTLAAIPEHLKTWFTPRNSAGIQGAKALWESSEGHQEYWLALSMFFKTLNMTGNRTENSVQ
jgi:hypothetical protein